MNVLMFTVYIRRILKIMYKTLVESVMKLFYTSNYTSLDSYQQQNVSALYDTAVLTSPFVINLRSLYDKSYGITFVSRELTSAV